MRNRDALALRSSAPGTRASEMTESAVANGEVPKTQSCCPYLGDRQYDGSSPVGSWLARRNPRPCSIASALGTAARLVVACDSPVCVGRPCGDRPEDVIEEPW